MEIVKVIVDELPECCGDCDRYESREKDGGYLHECHFGAGFIKDLGVRLSKCPLELEPEPHTFENTEVGEPWGKPTDFSKNKTLGKWQMGQKK